MQSNMEYLANGLYIVRTQAGFRKAVRDYYGRNVKGCELKGYPVRYPSLVALSDGYCGYHYVQANCIPLDSVSYAVEKHSKHFGEAQ